MELKDAVHRERVRRKEKEPFTPSLFSHIGGLVRRYRLKEDFLGQARALTPAVAESLARVCRSEAKPQYEAPLFFLATPEEFQVIQQVLTDMDNPYLVWARCPEEILLSKFLWQRRPGLEPEVLTKRHLAALL